MGYKVNKEKCIGCQVCVQTCPGATEIGKDGKARVIDQKKLEECGGESVCPIGAIEKNLRK
jgi:ferredoxin